MIMPYAWEYGDIPMKLIINNLDIRTVMDYAAQDLSERNQRKNVRKPSIPINIVGKKEQN